MSATHDPLCISRELLPADLIRFCDCERVAQVRADERERIAQALENYGGGGRPRINNWQNAAAQIARNGGQQ